jgi:hypothetical protein
MKKLFIIIAVALLPCWVGATTYYVIDLPATGCADNNPASATVDGTNYNPIDEDCDGGGSDSYYTTIADLNNAAATTVPGDTISFNKGGTWRESLLIPESGTNGNPITYTSHGTGDAPIINGGTAIATWTQSTGENMVDQDGGAGSDTDKGSFVTPGLLGAEAITVQNDRDFSSGTIGNWGVTKDGSGTLTYDTTDIGGADDKQAVLTSDSDLYLYATISTSNFSATTNTLYKFTANVYVPDANVVETVVALVINFAGSVSETSQDVIPADTWTEKVFYFATGADATGTLRLGNSQNPSDGDKFYFDDVSIKPVDFSWVFSSTNLMYIKESGGETDDGFYIKGNASDDKGATLALSSASDLDANLVVSTSYTVAFDAKVGSGDSVDVEVAQSDDTQLGTVTVTETTFTAKSFTFTASNVSTDKIQLDNLANGEEIWIDNLQVYKTVQTNVWQASLADPPWVITVDDTRGKEESTFAALTVANEWYHDDTNDIIYVYSTTDPDGKTVEGATRSYCIKLDGKDYITIENLTLTMSEWHVLNIDNDSDNVTIDGITAKHAWVSGLAAQYEAGFLNNLTIKNSIFSQNGNNGIGMNEGYDVLIQNNTANNNCLRGNASTAGIRYVKADDYPTNVTVEYNKVYRNGYFLDDVASSTEDGNVGHGIHGDETAGNSIIRYNLIYDNLNLGISQEISDNTETYGNIVDGSGNCGIAITAWGSHTNTGNKVYNNTLYDNRYGICAWGSLEANAGQYTNNIFRNNIVYGSDSESLIARWGGENDGTVGSGNVYTNNAFGAEGTDFIMWAHGNHDDTYADWYSAYAAANGNTVEGDPQMTNPASNDFTLKYSSPAYDAGTNLGATYDDCLHPSSSWPSSVTTVKQGLYPRWEIGAYCILKQQGPGVGLMQ